MKFDGLMVIARKCGGRLGVERYLEGEVLWYEEKLQKVRAVACSLYLYLKVAALNKGWRGYVL